MNTQKAIEYFKRKLRNLKQEYDALEEDSQMCGPMSDWDRENRWYACSRRSKIPSEMAELNDILGDNDENKC